MIKHDEWSNSAYVSMIIDYGQQYNTNTQKPVQQQTYRPTATTQTQAPTPQRETYVKQEPQYEQRPAQTYNPDFDEGLIAQVSVI